MPQTTVDFPAVYAGSLELLQNAQYRPHNGKYSGIHLLITNGEFRRLREVIRGKLENYSQSIISIVGEENTQDLSNSEVGAVK